MRSATKGTLKTTPVVSGQAQFVYQNNEVNGYRAVVSNLLSTATISEYSTSENPVIFGKWSDLVVGLWGGLDITVDPYSQSSTGKTRIVALQNVDVAVRNLQSFAAVYI